MSTKMPKWAVLSFIVWLLILFIGAYFRTSFNRYHQSWMEGTFQVLIGICWFIPSFSLCVAPGITIGLMQSISALGKQWNVEEWKKLSITTKYKIFGIGLINLLIGILLITNGSLMLLLE